MKTKYYFLLAMVVVMLTTGCTAKQNQEINIEAEVVVPSGGWTLSIKEVYIDSNNIYVITEIFLGGGVSFSETIKDNLRVLLPEGEYLITFLVYAKTARTKEIIERFQVFENPIITGDYKFIESYEKAKASVLKAKLVYP